MSDQTQQNQARNEKYFELLKKFLDQKNNLFRWLNQGIVIKAEWDNTIREAEELGLEASKHQLLRYYQHYRIGELGTELFL